MATATETRQLEVTTPLSEEVVLTGFSGGEAVSRLFSYQLEMESAAAIDPNDLIGKSVTWRVANNAGEPRYFNGLVSRFAASSVEMRGLRVYRAKVVPWLWFLTRAADCRIFQNRAAPDIIEQVFTDLGYKKNTDFKLNLSGTYPSREYCVQYRETAFNFVSRLMEQEGIFYFFVHDDGSHLMVLGDQKTTYATCAEKEVVYSPARRGPGLIASWEHQFAFRSGQWTQTDYNFETPRSSLLTSSETVLTLDDAKKYELFDYPGEYQVKAAGTTATKTRMEEEEVTFEVVTGTGGCCTFSPGGKFTMKTHEAEAEQGKSYVLTAVQHVGSDFTTSNTTRRPSYSNSFTCIPADVLFRPARLTIKPAVQGPQTAVVVGPSGQEIYTDKYGRIKVQFFWDRRGKLDENSSCWMRVAQVWAGKRWGASFWPRIGQEVVVDFLEGDPDRPLIVGSVYNAEQMPPYQGNGPDSKHASDNKVSGIKSSSTPGGDGYNELRFDDTQGKEQVFVHAQNNMDVNIIANLMTSLGGDASLTIGQEKDGKKSGDQKVKIFQDQHIHILRHQVEHVEGNLQLLVGKGSADDGGNVDVSIEKDAKELIGGAHHFHVKGTQNVQVDGTQDVTVGGDYKELHKGKSHLHVKGDSLQKVDGAVSLTVGTDQQIKAGGKHAVEAAQEIHLKAGQTVILEAGAQLTIKGPGGFVDIGPAGVTIQGVMVKINSGGSAGSGSGSSPTAPEDAKGPTDAKDAKPAAPTPADDSKSGYKSAQ